jgi:hypothetical protein
MGFIMTNNCSNNDITPCNTEEKIVWYSIRYIWIFYLFGLLYVAGSAVAWILLFLLIYKFSKGDHLETNIVTWVWVSGMLIMLIAIIIGHINEELSTSSLIKSSIGWAKGWAILAIMPLASGLNIRTEILIRAMTHLGKQCLIITPILVIAAYIHLPSHIYTSPLKFLANASFFEIELYGLNSSTGLPRWRLFTPWGPALGLYGNLLLCISSCESNKKWRYFGICAGIAMVFVSQSRMGMLCMIFLPVFCTHLNKLKQLKYILILALVSPILAASFNPALNIAEQAIEKIHEQRSDSSRVRGALERIATERWKNEAPIWGHGVVEMGPHYVEYMPIGSHHTWLGLLFVKGLVGLFALAVPLLVTVLALFYKYFSHEQFRQKSTINRGGLHLVLLLCAYSLTENLEILAYLHWPALLFIALALKNNEQVN